MTGIILNATKQGEYHERLTLRGRSVDIERSGSGKMFLVYCWINSGATLFWTREVSTLAQAQRLAAAALNDPFAAEHLRVAPARKRKTGGSP